MSFDGEALKLLLQLIETTVHPIGQSSAKVIEALTEINHLIERLIDLYKSEPTRSKLQDLIQEHDKHLIEVIKEHSQSCSASQCRLLKEDQQHLVEELGKFKKEVFELLKPAAELDKKLNHIHVWIKCFIGVAIPAASYFLWVAYRIQGILP